MDCLWTGGGLGVEELLLKSGQGVTLPTFSIAKTAEIWNPDGSFLLIATNNLTQVGPVLPKTVDNSAQVGPV